jgi:hypothetical protein
MNSDFMQQQGAAGARLGPNPIRPRGFRRHMAHLRARVSDDEVKTGLAFLRSEPLKAYEERRAKDTKETKDTKESTKDTKEGAPEKAEGEAADAEPKADGMMAGVVPGAGKPEEKKKLLPVTPWGRYLKVLLSSNEFLFVS